MRLFYSRYVNNTNMTSLCFFTSGQADIQSIICSCCGSYLSSGALYLDKVLRVLHLTSEMSLHVDK